MRGRFSPTRRRVLQVGAALGGGLLIATRMSRGAGEPTSAEVVSAPFAPDAWIRVHETGAVSLLIDRSEMGQGTLTGLAMLVAEELEVDLAQIETRFAPAAPEYFNPLSGAQSTGGSTGIRGSWEPLRTAAATAREMLIAAAARRWSVAASECRAQHGAVVHASSGRQTSYGELASLAATLPPPAPVMLKEPHEFTVIGKPTPRLDALAKITGRARYGIDVEVTGKRVATILRCPVFGGRVRRFDAQAALALTGVSDVVQVPSGVAIVGDDTWSVLRARDLVDVDWAPGRNAALNSPAIRSALEAGAQRRGELAEARGNVDSALRRAARRIEASYETPYLAHATMEPINCTAHVHDGRCEVWVPTQAQTNAQEVAARASGLPQRAVSIYTTFLGGGFGRRLYNDFVAEAVDLSRRVKAPVQLIWTLADDLQHDYYRPANYTHLRAALDANGAPVAWHQRAVGPRSALGGIDIPYAIPHLRLERVKLDPGVPVGPWRSVGASQNAFVVESFIDELAHAAGRDPFVFRRDLLSKAPRHRGVLELAATKAGWGNPLPERRYRGIAVYYCYASWAAQVAEVEVTSGGDIALRRMVSAIDCGIAVNPDAVVAQLEGAVVMGLTAALRGEITIADGRVEQSGFHDYPLLSIAEMPEVEVHIVPSQQPPGGVGEPGLPPVAPALCNAIFAATGKRVRRLPLRTALGDQHEA